jgi:membrane associated rhomboid family serine protease
MAFRSNGPITLAFPPFRWVTRRIILAALICYLGLAVLRFVLPGMVETLVNLSMLVPDLALEREVWRFLTYPFIGLGLLSVAFALLSIWFFASSLEEERGSRWLSDYFFATTIGGGILASLVFVALGGRGGWLPYGSVAAGMWPFVLSTVVAFAYYQPESPVRFNFIFELKAKYLAAIYVLLYVAFSVTGGDRFGALVALMNAGCGYAFLRLAPRRGLRSGLSEWWFGLRNDYQRSKRRRAARKFAVYMRKQGKDVSLTEDGKYIDPDGKPRDLNDRNWMN